MRVYYRGGVRGKSVLMDVFSTPSNALNIYPNVFTDTGCIEGVLYRGCYRVYVERVC